MTTTTTINQSHFGEILVAERARLLGLCTYLTGDPESAEDVVQEVMLEAWRSFGKLRDPNAMAAWLNGIVRNVYARWQRTRGREAMVLLHDVQSDGDVDSRLETVAEDFDLEVALERHELALLLDRALALLPATTREVLIGKYIAESRHAELAQRLGLTENAVTVCLHRGKVALRKVLTTKLRSEAEAFGLVTTTDEWVETRLWCPTCGQRRIMGKLTATELLLRCPTCTIEPKDYLLHYNWSGSPTPFGQVKGFRPILKQLASQMYQHWMSTLQRGEYLCPVCNIASPLYFHLPAWAPASMHGFHGMHVVCPRCAGGGNILLAGVALSSPAGQAFFQDHPRIHALPERTLEFEGAPALLQSSASVTDAATFEVIMHRESYAILASYRSDEK